MPPDTSTHAPMSTEHIPEARWTPERIRALGPVTTVSVAAAIFGLSRSVAYELIRRNQFPVQALRFGSRYRIPVAAILTALHLPTEPDPGPRPTRSAAPTTGGDLTTGRRHASITDVKSAAPTRQPTRLSLGKEHDRG